MGFPSRKDINQAKKALKDVVPVRLLPANASKADCLKFELCKQFVVYLRENELTQLELAKRLRIDPARLNEVVKYRIELFTIDKLMDYAERLKPTLKISVA